MFEFLGIGREKKTEVLLLRERDKRFERIKIINETDTSLESAKIKGVSRHFIKHGSGYMEKGTGKTIFFAFEAGGKTSLISEGETTKMTVSETVKTLVGDEIWNKIDPEIKEKLEHSQFGVIVEPINQSKNDPKGIGNENRHTESDHKMIDYFAETVSDKIRKGLKNSWIMPFAAGGGIIGLIVYIAVHAGYLK